MKINLSQRGRRTKVYDGVILGYTPAQLARFLDVSETTIRRDMRHFGFPATAVAGVPEGMRSRADDSGDVFL